MMSTDLPTLPVFHNIVNDSRFTIDYNHQVISAVASDIHFTSFRIICGFYTGVVLRNGDKEYKYKYTGTDGNGNLTFSHDSGWNMIVINE